MEPDSLVLLDVADGVAVLTLNRPEARNALSPELIARLQQTCAECDGRDDVAAMVLIGADPAFCGGIDLKRLAAGTSGAIGLIGDTPFPAHRKPIIGAINGAAVTGGLELALACDFLIASERARFADTHARVGVMPGWGLTVALPQAVGLRRAKQMSFTGNYVDAPTALSWGLVNEVVAHEQLLSRARQLALDVASIRTACVQEIRSIYDEVADRTGDDARQFESQRSRTWMKEQFDRTQLASDREDIVRRGSAQIS
ncbi:MAG: enoyl-CoA hydratase [Acidimicrobiales bacterium]